MGKSKQNLNFKAPFPCRHFDYVHVDHVRIMLLHVYIDCVLVYDSVYYGSGWRVLRDWATRTWSELHNARFHGGRGLTTQTMPGQNAVMEKQLKT